MTKASIIIPTYNLSRMLIDTVFSVLGQTERNLEVLVVDDGSTDDTLSVIQGVSDRRLKYFYKKNGGVSSARNFGLAQAQGEFIAFLDHDDLWPANYLEVMIRDLEKKKQFGLAYSRITLMHSDGSQITSYKAREGKSGWLAADLFKTGFIWTSAAVIRKHVLENFYYDESLRRSYEDSDFFLRLSARIQCLFVQGVEAIRREHGENLSERVGTLPTKILVLERFYFREGGNERIPANMAKRRISHAYRKVAEANRHESNRSAAIALFKKALKYYPWDIRLYSGLLKTFMITKRRDRLPEWKLPESLPDLKREEDSDGE